MNGKETVELVIDEIKYRQLENGEWEYYVDDDLWFPVDPEEWAALDHITYLHEALQHLGDELGDRLEYGEFGIGHHNTVYWKQLIYVARNPVKWATE